MTHDRVKSVGWMVFIAGNGDDRGVEIELIQTEISGTIAEGCAGDRDGGRLSDHQNGSHGNRAIGGDRLNQQTKGSGLKTRIEPLVILEFTQHKLKRRDRLAIETRAVWHGFSAEGGDTVRKGNPYGHGGIALGLEAVAVGNTVPTVAIAQDEFVTIAITG